MITKTIIADRTLWRDEDGLLHREDGPAIIMQNGTKYWYCRGYLHREDGPAIINVFGEPPQWYLNGQNMQNFEEYVQLLGRNEELISYYLLKYGIMQG